MSEKLIVHKVPDKVQKQSIEILMVTIILSADCMRTEADRRVLRYIIMER